jgi:hypothetical protein
MADLHYNPVSGGVCMDPRRNGRPARLRGRGMLAAAALALALLATNHGSPGFGATAPQRGPSFAAQVASLSEPGGYFDTDNLISNERSYLQVIDQLRSAGVRGGAYIGVGPDTNFSYIAEIQPSIAFIVDVRRDNLLLHLLFKAIFRISASRVEYMATLLGREVPSPLGSWRQAPIDRLVTQFDGPPAPAGVLAARRRLVEAEIRSTGIPLSDDDLTTIARFHQQFIDSGLTLRFNSAGRAPQIYYPTYRDLLLETDTSARQANYLASERAFEFVKDLQARDLIIPVIGDLAGPSALSSIARLLASRRETLSAFYTSNVEFYLYSRGTFQQFVSNLRRIPRNGRSTVIRSVFGRYNPSRRPNDVSTSQLHLVQDFLRGVDDGRFRSYGDLVNVR